jgi:phage gpG-like protein
MAEPGKNTVIKLVGCDVITQFTTTGQEQLIQKLDHFSAGSKDFTAVFMDFDNIMQASIQNNFKAEGRPQSWQPLALSTVSQRIREGYGGAHPILVRSGRMKRGFKARIGKRSYAVYNKVFYFNYHQFGTPKMAARPMVVMLKGLRSNFTEIARKHLGMVE